MFHLLDQAQWLYEKRAANCPHCGAAHEERRFDCHLCHIDFSSDEIEKMDEQRIMSFKRSAISGLIFFPIFIALFILFLTNYR
ncbi:hypothetical protein [Microbulbifer sp. TRSA005]|jgi:ribosomal protein S27AE|uniref:hypothetical protein n=1 Tax=unclassified Microbulbifer TaxID=2619833 RepID=UPI0040395F54